VVASSSSVCHESVFRGAVQGQSFHGNSFDHVIPANTLKDENEKFYVSLPWFSDTPYVGTQKNLSDKMRR
jgi:hypothetical protein